MVIVGIILVASLIGLVYLLSSSKEITGPESYPKSVKNAINNPIEKNENWSTLVSNDDFQISYSTSEDVDSFFITINAQPALEVSLKAEQSLLQKLGIKEEDACKLPVLINVPAIVDENLTAFEFGLSFCSDVVRISDIPPQEQESTSPTNTTTTSTIINSNNIR